MLVRSLERESCLGVVIEKRRRAPLHRVVALLATCLRFPFGELPAMHVFVARGALGTSSFEIDALNSGLDVRGAMALTARDRQVRAGERKRRFGMIEVSNLQPGVC